MIRAWCRSPPSAGPAAGSTGNLRGQDAIALVEERTDTESWKGSFTETEELGTITTRRFGYPINIYRLYVGRGFVPPGE